MLTNTRFNIIQFLLIYVVLNYGFLAYIGIISPGGYYVAFLHHYADAPAWLTYAICSGAKGILTLTGHTVVQKSANVIAIAGSRGVRIIWACLGVGVMSFWIAFVSAHKGTWAYKAKWTAWGIGGILLLNVIRIALIAYANYYDWKAFNAIEPHFAFNMASYGVITGFTLLFIWQYRRVKSESRRENTWEKGTENPLTAAVIYPNE